MVTCIELTTDCALIYQQEMVVVVLVTVVTVMAYYMDDIVPLTVDLMAVLDTFFGIMDEWAVNRERLNLTLIRVALMMYVYEDVVTIHRMFQIVFHSMLHHQISNYTNRVTEMRPQMQLAEHEHMLQPQNPGLLEAVMHKILLHLYDHIVYIQPDIGHQIYPLNVD